MDFLSSRHGRSFSPARRVEGGLDPRLHAVELHVDSKRGVLWGRTEPNRRHCDMAPRGLQLDATIGCCRRLQTYTCSELN